MSDMKLIPHDGCTCLSDERRSYLAEPLVGIDGLVSLVMGYAACSFNWSFRQAFKMQPDRSDAEASYTRTEEEFTYVEPVVIRETFLPSHRGVILSEGTFFTGPMADGYHWCETTGEDMKMMADDPNTFFWSFQPDDSMPTHFESTRPYHATPQKEFRLLDAPRSFRFKSWRDRVHRQLHPEMYLTFGLFAGDHFDEVPYWYAVWLSGLRAGNCDWAEVVSFLPDTTSGRQWKVVWDNHPTVVEYFRNRVRSRGLCVGRGDKLRTICASDHVLFRDDHYDDARPVRCKQMCNDCLNEFY